MKKLALGLVILFGLLVTQGAPSTAQTADFTITIPISTIANGPEGTTEPLLTEATPAELIGQTCSVLAEGFNQDSVHPNTDLGVASGGTMVEIFDVERDAFAVTPANGTLTLGPEIDVGVRFGSDGLFSGGFLIHFDCNGTTTTTTTTPDTTTTTTTPDTTTTTTTPDTTTTTTTPDTTTTTTTPGTTTTTTVPCPYDPQLPVNDPDCNPCPYNPEIPADSDDCNPCPYNPDLPENSDDCNPCPYNPDLPENSDDCNPCEDDPSLPADDPDCARIEVAAFTPVCQADIPFIAWDIEVTGTTSNTATITFVDLDGNVVETLTDQPLIGRTVYPGASVDPQDWPGWVLNSEGLWVPDPSDANLRDGLDIIVEVNPTAEAAVEYPPATEACNSPENPSGGAGSNQPGGGSASNLPVTGGETLLTALFALLLLSAGGSIILFTRRNAS